MARLKEYTIIKRTWFLAVFVALVGMVIGGLSCSGGSSSTKTSCTSNIQCLNGQVCANGSCVASSSCTTDAQCLNGQVCQNGSCIAKTSVFPTIQNISVQGVPALPGNNITATVVAQSPQGLALTYTWTVSNSWTVVQGGNTPTVTIKAPNSFNMSGIATITVADTNGEYTTGTTSLSTQTNSPPVISSITASPNPVDKGGSMVIAITAIDPDGDTLSYTWFAPSDWSVQTGQGTTTVTVIAPDQYADGGNITVTVSDGYNGYIIGSLPISTVNNTIPVISNLNVSSAIVSPNSEITATVSASDSDGDTLSYSWTTTTGWELTGYGTTATVIAPNMHSVSGNITVTVSDGFGGNVTGTVVVATNIDTVPIITSLSVFPQPVTSTAYFTGSAYDPDGDILSSWNYTWLVDGLTISTGSSAIWYSSGIPGYYTTILKVIDAYGGIATSSTTFSVTSNSPWTKFRGNIQSTGLSAIDTSSTPDTLQWGYLIGTPIYWSSPAIGTDGTIYVGSYGGNLYAINPDGTFKWEYNTGGWIHSSPAIGADGTIYVGSYDNHLYAINPNGSLEWAYITPGSWIYSSPAIGADGTIYVGSADGNLYAINPNGTLKWTYSIGSEIDSSPSIGVDGTIYVGSNNNNLYAIDLPPFYRAP